MLHLNTYKLSQDHLTERNPVQEDHDYCDPPNISVISEFKKASIHKLQQSLTKHFRVVFKNCLKLSTINQTS